jgi:homoserine kinase
MTGRRSVTAFAPASIGNVAVGFDILGHSIAGPVDHVTVTRAAGVGVRILGIEGDDAIPRDAARNTAGAALLALGKELQLDFGFEITLRKGIAFGSGMGGSAASAVAALVAANELLERPLSREALYPFAMSGEAVASGGRHGDNVGPMLMGGLCISTAERIVQVDVPEEWCAAVIHPHAVLETRRSREALAGTYELREFVEQSANLAQTLVACFRGDAALMRLALRDTLVEPRRASLIRGFHETKAAALDHHAMGASISGGGPSVFAWFESRTEAELGGAAMRRALRDRGVESDLFVSPIAGPRAGIVR